MANETKEYIGIKLIKAQPMTRGEYNKKRGWKIPADENPDDEGYVVQYSDNYISWSPKEAFEKSYTEVQEPEFRKTEITFERNGNFTVNWVR